MKTILRDYQTEDKKRIYKALEEFFSVLYQLPTGGGKSVVISSIIEDHRDENIIIFAHKRKLLLQLKNQLLRAGITAGVLAGEIQENLDSNIIIVSIQTAVQPARLEKLLKRKVDKIIIDEARHSRTNSYDKVLEELISNNFTAQIIGVDATPMRNDNRRLDKNFEALVTSSETIASLTEKGFLLSAKAIVSPINMLELKEEVTEHSNDYQVSSLSAYMRREQYLEYLVSQYVTYGEEKPAIVFAVDKNHARDIVTQFELGGYVGKVERVDSDSTQDEIKEMYARFESGVTQILVNVEMITEGVDLPICGCIIGARPTKSLTLFMQILGRGMRPDGISEYFVFLDCCGWTQTFGTISAPKTWSLNPDLDPNSGRVGNKILGKKEDGTYTEDLEDFFGEVIEMTPEEYAAKIGDGEEQAKVTNATIDEKIKSAVERIVALVTTKSQTDKFIKTFDVGYNLNIYFKLGTSNRRTALVLSDSSFYSEAPSFYSDEKDVFYKLSSLSGSMNEVIGSKDVEKKAREILAVIRDLKKSKVNLEIFREARAQMKLQKRWQKVESHILEGKKFELRNKVYASDFFRMDNSSIKITGLTFRNRKMQINNIVDFDGVTYSWGGEDKISTFQKPAVRQDKLMEILERGNWGFGDEII